MIKALEHPSCEERLRAELFSLEKSKLTGIISVYKCGNGALLTSRHWQGKGQWAPVKMHKIPSELKTFLYNEGGKTLALATQRGYGVTISGDIQSPAGRGPGQTALADTV